MHNLSKPSKKLRQSRFKSTHFQRPKSAVVSSFKSEIQKMLYEKPNHQPQYINELKPWSKISSPPLSRPGSSCTNKRRLHTKSSSKLISIPCVNDSCLETLNDNQIQISVNKFEHNCIGNAVNSAIHEYFALNPKEGTLFPTEIQSFVHDNFPARKIKRFYMKKPQTFSCNFEIPEARQSRKKSFPLKPCYFQLKRRYHPIKCKIDYVPRHLHTPNRYPIF